MIKLCPCCKPQAATVLIESLPASILRLARDKMNALLDEMVKAGRKSMELKGVEYAGELSAQLLSHAKQLEALFEKLQEASWKDPPNESAVSKFVSECECECECERE